MRYWLVGVVLSVVIGLALSGGLIFQEWVHEHWADNPDSVAIATAGMKADGHTALGWWTGPWIEGETFYRPLSSTLMWIETRLWGMNFFPYTLVSWVMHALNSALVFLLLYSLCRGPQWQRAASALVAALLFNLGKHPSGPDWIEARVAWGVMPYWPVQTDLGALGCGLASLLCLDRHLLTGRRCWFVSAVALAVAGLLFKETALAVVLLAPLLALHRWGAWGKVAVWYAVPGALFLGLRAVMLPEASNPEWMGGQTFFKLLNWIHWLSSTLLQGGEIWEYVTVGTLIPLVYVLWRKRLSVVYLVLACLVWPLVIGGALTGNPAIATIPREMLILLRVAGVLVGLTLVLRTWRTEPAILFLVGLLIIAAGQVNRIGPHYWYWPAAFWGLLDGAALNAAVSHLRRWRAGPPSATEAAAGEMAPPPEEGTGARSA